MPGYINKKQVLYYYNNAIAYVFIIMKFDR